MRAGIFIAIVLVGLAAAPAWEHEAWAHKATAPVKAGNSLLTPSDKKSYEAAFHKAEKNQFRSARKLASKAKSPLPAKIIQWLELTASGPGGDFAEASVFLAQNPNWPGQASLHRRAELAMPKDFPDLQVLAWFEARPPITAKGAAQFAQALIRKGEKEQATQLLRKAWIERNFSRRDERDFHKRFKKMLRREDDIARLDRLLWDHKFRPAIRLARRLGKGYPALAEARQQLARRGPGVDWAIKRIPAELQDDPGLIYERVRWRQVKNRYEDVIELLDPPNPAAPQAKRWWRLRKWAARQAYMKGDYKLAYRIASAHGLGTGIGFAEGEWFAGWLALRFLDRPEKAYEHFTHLHDGVLSPISLARSAYWSGEAARVLDERDPSELWHAKAQNWYTIAAKHASAFYGQLAGRRLDQPLGFTPATVEPPSAEARATFDQRELVQAIRLLGELGQDKLHRLFLLRLGILAEDSVDYLLTVELATEQKRPDLAVRTAKAARKEGILLPEYLYPGLEIPQGGTPEPALVLAVIRQESGFYTQAVSGAGARGLMQLMPRTAKHVARRIKLRYSRDKLLSDPEYNMRLGRVYLSDLTKKYDGSYVLALAAYNAGPSRANAWIKLFGDPRDPSVDPIDWVESIPFDETRNYVQRIIEGLVIYRQNLGIKAGHPLQVHRLSPLRSLAQREEPAELSCCL